MKKLARWVGKRWDPTTIRYALRAGRRGTGRELGYYAITQRADNSCAGDEHAGIIEKKAAEHGYKIVRD